MNNQLLRLPRRQPSIPPRAQRLKTHHVCQAAYFPHYRVHNMPDSGKIPNSAHEKQTKGSQGLLGQVTGPRNLTAESLSNLTDPVQLQLACSSLLGQLQTRVEAMYMAMTAAYQKARVVWQYLCICWPAWQSSLCEDMEFLVEYTVGLLSAWLISMYTALSQVYTSILSAPRVRRVLETASSTVTDLRERVKQLQKVVADVHQGTQSRPADSPPLQQLIGLMKKTPSSSSNSSELVSSLAHSMAALSIADLALLIPGRNRNHRSNISEVAHSAEARAQLINGAPFDAEAKWSELCAAAKSRYEAATSGLQQVVVEPLQHAGFIASDGRSPTVAGVIAAASVLLAGSVYRSMQQNAQAAEERMLQQVQLQMKAESLAAQRARFRRALGDAQAAAAGSAAGTRRRSSSPPENDAWEDTSPASPLAPAGQSVRGAGITQTMVPRLDADAAREYQKFMAGAKAVDVPMWDSHLVEELPKVSIKELQRQTQKIRAAATAEERAAMEDAESRRQLVEQQLNSQLQELSGAPVGRAAREAWRKEQQQRKLQEQEAQASKQAAGAEAGDSRSKSRSSSSSGSSDSNPFAIPTEARAQWEAEDHLYTDAKPKANSSGGWGFGLNGKAQQQRQQPQQSVSQQVRQRRFADVGVSGAAAGAAAESSSKNGSNRPQANVVAAAVSPPSTRHNAASEQQKLQGTAAAAAAAVGEPAEGSPEWEAKMREEMMRSGAARRARRQQMQQQPAMQNSNATAAAAPEGSDTAAALQGQQPKLSPAAVPAVARSSTTAPSSPGAAVSSNLGAVMPARELPEQAINRPKLPTAGGSAAETSDQVSGGSRLTVLGRIGTRDRSNTGASSNDLSAVSARDAQGITAQAAAPSPDDMQRMDTAAAGRAEAAAEARAAAVKPPGQSQSVEKGEAGNPFAVDKDAVLDDDTAIELGKKVDKEAKRIKWRSMMQ